MTRKLLTSLLIALTALLGPAQASAQDVLPDRPAGGGGDVLPDRPTPGGGEEIQKKTEQAIEDIYERWEEDRNPKLLVMIGIQNGGQVVYNTESQMINRIISPLKRHLRDATDRRSIIVPSLKELRDNQVVDRLARDAGKALPDGGADILKKQFDADLIIDLTLLSSNERGRYALNMNVYDTRESIELASDSLSTVGTDTTEARGVVIADAIIRSFAREYAQGRRPARREFRTFEFKLLGVEKDGGISQRKLRDLAGELEDADDNVKWAEFDFAGVEDTGYAKFETRFGGRQRDLLNLIEDKVLPRLDLAWRVQQTDGNVIVAYVYPGDIPAWYAITDPGAPDFKDTIRKRNAGLTRAGLPRLGIVIGEDLQEPIGEFTSDGGKRPTRFEHATLTGALQNRFTDLGFRVVAADALRRQMQAQLGNAKRYQNLPHLESALKEMQGVELILHINTQEVDGVQHLNARLFDVGKAQFVGFQQWPDQAVNRLTRFSVDAGDANEVARYLAGQLVTRYDRFADQDAQSLAVQVRNISDPQMIMAIVDVVKQSVPGVEAVAGLKAVTPVMSFDIIHSDNTAGLKIALIDLISTRFPGSEVQSLGETMIVNLSPNVLSEEELAAREEKEVELDPADDDPAGGDDNNDNGGNAGTDTQPGPGDNGTQANTSSAGLNPTERVVTALRSARQSVWLIYFQTEDSGWIGTGWTVAPGLLATNAHVVGDVPERLARGEEVVAFAFNDSDRAVRLKLGRAWRHPKWRGDRGFELDEFWYDVGLVEVVEGDPGKPLPIATEDELDKLVPPMIAGYVGFPSGGTIKQKDGDLPGKQAFIGQINAVMDTKLVPGQQAEDRMVMHNMTSHKGASGSPIFGESGKVVALLNSGQLDQFLNSKGERELIGTGFNGGVMVDILLDFMKSLEAELPKR